MNKLFTKVINKYFLSLYGLFNILFVFIIFYKYVTNNIPSDVVLYTFVTLFLETIFTFTLFAVCLNYSILLYQLFVFVFLCIYIVQTYIFYYTDSLLTGIMWDNIDQLFDAWTLYSINLESLGILIWILGLATFVTFNSKKFTFLYISKSIHKKVLYLVIPVYIIGTYQAARFQNDYIKYSSLFMPPIAGIINLSFSPLTFTLYEYFLLNNKFTEFNLNEQYPLNKHIMPSQNIDNFLIDRLSKPDIFLVFMEGTSSYLLDGHSSSKHISDFFHDGLVVKNYFNHTASTIRGLHGQLTSTYTRMRPTATQVKNSGWLFSNFEDGNWLIPRLSSSNTTKYDSLVTVLKKEGYYSIFIHPEGQGTVLDVMAHSLGFDEIIGRNAIEVLVPKSKSDRLFDIFSRDEYVVESSTLLHEKHKSQSAMPLCIVLYTVGTHSFAAPSNQNMKFYSLIWLYQRIESFDKDIRILFDYYERLTSEKLFILTTDHAIFPEPDYAELRKEDQLFVPIIIDKIPLFIKSNKIVKNVIDVHGRNSIDLVPTILDLIEGPKRHASFMGTSLFIENNTNYSVSALGDEMYLINNDRVVVKMSPEERSIFDKLSSNIRLVYQLEKQNRISIITR